MKDTEPEDFLHRYTYCETSVRVYLLTRAIKYGVMPNKNILEKQR